MYECHWFNATMIFCWCFRPKLLWIYNPRIEWWMQKAKTERVWYTNFHLMSMFRFCLDFVQGTARASIDFNSFQVHRVEISLRLRLCKLCGTVICALFHLQSFAKKFQHVNIIFSINIWWQWPKGPMPTHTQIFFSSTQIKKYFPIGFCRYIKRIYTQCLSSFFWLRLLCIFSKKW